MRWASAYSEHADLGDAFRECAVSVRREMANETCDLLVVFVSNRHEANYALLPELVAGELPSTVLIGCSADGVIGGAREIEGRPGLAVTAAHLPEVTLVPFSVSQGLLPSPDDPPAAWQKLAGVPEGESPHFVILAEPYSFQPEALLAGLDYAFPHAVKIGGLASGASQPGQNVIYVGDRVLRSGCGGLAIFGNIEVDAVVAQGARPIGNPAKVTRCREHLLFEIDDRPAVTFLRDVLENLSEPDRQLARHALSMGIVMDDFCEEPRQGDFLIRNLMGIDPRSGVLAIGEQLHEGQIVQFQLRDASTAREDLETLLTNYVWDEVGRRPEGALLFSCLGRGERFFGRPDHDTELFQSRLGKIPLGGFFCNGEIGPVGGTTFLHGYTSSFGLFRPKNRLESPSSEI